MASEQGLINTSIENSTWLPSLEFMMNDFLEAAKKGRYQPSRQYVAVGTDRDVISLNCQALTIVMKNNHIHCEFYPALSREAKVSGEVEQVDNVYYLYGKPKIESFVELMAGDFAIPMGETLDDIEKVYNSGGKIYLIPAEIHWPLMR